MKSLPILCMVFVAAPALLAAQATVRVEAANLDGPRALESQTAKAVIQDYIESWQSLRSAFDQNRPDLLDKDFVGDAKNKLSKAIQDQSELGIHTRYSGRSHDLKILFYSPEGLSIQLADNVEYDVAFQGPNKSWTTQHVRARYVTVLTPSESRWRVRVFQATEPE